MNKKDFTRNFWMLNGKFARQGYDWWWHNFTGINEKTGEEKTFFIEYFTCNPALKNQLGNDAPICGQLPSNKENGIKPSYLMVKCGWWGNDAVQLHRFIPWKDVSITNLKKGKAFPSSNQLRQKLPLEGVREGKAFPSLQTSSQSSATPSAGLNRQPATPGYFLQALDCTASDTYLTGSANITDSANHPEWMCNDGSMEWDISINKDVAFNVGYGASKIFRDLKAYEMYWHAEGMKSLYSGTVTANGQKYIIKPETSFGYADKNWGSNFTTPWVWLSSNDLVSKITGKKLENSVFDIGGGRPKVFGIGLDRKLLSDYWYEGKSYEFNFSKFWTGCKTQFDCKETEDKIIWYVRQETHTAVMETNAECKKSEMLLVNYESPDGKKRHNRLWNGGTGTANVKLYKKVKGKLELIDEVEAKHLGCEYGEYDK